MVADGKDPQRPLAVPPVGAHANRRTAGALPALELDSVGQILSQLQQAFSDAEPFNHPMLAEFENPGDDEEAAQLTAARLPCAGRTSAMPVTAIPSARH